MATDKPKPALCEQQYQARRTQAQGSCYLAFSYTHRPLLTCPQGEKDSIYLSSFLAWTLPANKADNLGAAT